MGDLEAVVLKQLDKLDTIATQVSNLDLKLSKLDSKVEALRHDVVELQQDTRRMELQLSWQDGLIKGAVTVNIGAYLAPVIGLLVIAKGPGFFTK